MGIAIVCGQSTDQAHNISFHTSLSNLVIRLEVLSDKTLDALESLIDLIDSTNYIEMDSFVVAFKLTH